VASSSDLLYDYVCQKCFYCYKLKRNLNGLKDIVIYISITMSINPLIKKMEKYIKMNKVSIEKLKKSIDESKTQFKNLIASYELETIENRRDYINLLNEQNDLQDQIKYINIKDIF
jgi:hypothetical protein